MTKVYFAVAMMAALATAGTAFAAEKAKAVMKGPNGEDMGTVVRQGIRLGVGLGLMTLIACISPHHFRMWAPLFYAVGVILLVLVAFIGEGRGAQRWLDLGFLRFQPSEVLKLSLPMMLAWYLHRASLPPGWRQLVVCGVIIAIPALLIYLLSLIHI